MPASYPSSIKSWTDKVDNIDEVVAADVNTVYAEITAIETDLLGGYTDYSADSTITGWSSFTTKYIHYTVLGKVVFVQFRLSGTSNASGTSFTLPYSAGNYQRPSILLRVADNGTTAVGLAEVPENTSTCILYPAITGGQWTASGTKFAYGELFYVKT